MRKSGFFWKTTDAVILSTTVCVGIILSGCSPKTSKTTLPLNPPERFSFSGETQAPERWWTAFGDQQLDSLIEVALDSNFTLMSVWQRFLAAQAVVDRESSYLLPDLEATLQSGLNYPEPDFAGGENMRIGLSSVYEVDLWGRMRSTVEAERYRAEASFYDYKTAAISLTGEITLTWYQLLASWRQLELIESQLENNRKMLSLIEAQFGSGQIRSVDILRQRQLVEATREQEIILESQIQILEHQLAVLTGQAPNKSIEYMTDSLPELPSLPETGIPTDLIQRRPDVQVAFNLLRAADKDLATAISSKYPRLTFSTSVSVRANNAEELFQDWAYSLAANIVAPLFYGGRIRAEIDRTEAVRKQLLYEYGQTVLIAFQEVEDALIQERKQRESIRVLEEQLALAEQVNEQLKIEYFNGMSDYLSVLTALIQEQQLRRDLISAKLILFEIRIALYRALAGGFSTTKEGDKSSS